jgi:hypothetical protein
MLIFEVLQIATDTIKLTHYWSNLQLLFFMAYKNKAPHNMFSEMNIFNSFLSQGLTM